MVVKALSQDVLDRAYAIQLEAQRQDELSRQAAAQAAAEQAARTAPRSFGQVAGDAGIQLLQGAVGLGQAAYGVGNILSLGTLDRATGFSQNFQDTNQILNAAKSQQTQYQRQQAQQTFDNEGTLAGVGAYLTSPTLLQDLVVSNLPSLIPAAGAGRAAAGAAAEYATARGLGQTAAQKLVADRAESAVLRTTGAQTGGAVNVDAINQIREAGGDENQQQLGGLGAGIAAGVAAPVISRLTGAAKLESAAANALPGGVAGILPNQGIARGVLGGAAKEGAEEYLQSGTEQLSQNAVTPDKGLWEGVGQQAALGAVAGGLLGGGMGGVAGIGTPRASAGTPLGQTIREMLGATNAEQGTPLRQSALLDPVVPSALVTAESGPLDAEAIDLAETPLPGELPLAQQLPQVEEINFSDAPLPNLPRAAVRELPVEEVAGAPAPLRSLYDITGRQPQVAPSTAPLPTMGVEELPPTPLTGALAVIQAQRTRGQLGGTDLFAGPLAPEGAFPAQAAGEPVATPTASATNQASLDFNAPLPTWKQTLAKELGLKPASFRGKAWDQFTTAAEAVGVQPGTPEAAAFLATVAPQLAADPASAPLFAAKLAEKYKAAEPAAPAPATTAPAPVAAAAPTVVGSKQIRSGYADEGTYHEVQLSDGQTARIFKQTGDGGLALSGWYYNDQNPANPAKYLGETKADALKALPSVVPPALKPTGTLSDVLNLSEEQVLAKTNPGGESISDDDRIRLSYGDIDAPTGSTPVSSFTDKQGHNVDVVEDVNGVMYAQVDGKTAGMIGPYEDDATVIDVVEEAKGAGIGTGLAMAYARKHPNLLAGGYSAGGEAVARAAYRALRAEQEAAIAYAPPVVQQGTSPGSPAVDELAPTYGIDGAINKYVKLDPTATRAEAVADAFSYLLSDANSSDLLDETFIAIKNHPAWKELSSAQQTDVAEEFDLRYQRIEGGYAGKFNRTNGAEVTPMGTQQFAELVASANRTRLPTDPQVVPVEDAAQFETMTGQAAPQDAAGVFLDGTVYLIRQNLATPKDLALTLAHERGHHGLAVLLGDRLPAVVNRLWTNAATRDRIKAKMKALAGNVEPKDGGMRRLAAEEVLADMLGNNEKINGDVITKARSAVENFFARSLGYADLKMTNADVDKLLRDVGSVMRGNSAATINGEKPDHLQGMVDMMADPASAAAGDPRFSRTLADLDEIAAAADAEGPGTRRTVNDVTKALGQASLDTVKNIGSSFTQGGVFGTLLDATPLNQLVNLYGKLFSNGGDRPLNEFASLKRGKESTFNKALTQSADLKYRDSETKITTSPLDLANKWQAFQRSSPAKADALNKLQQFSTLYRLWPDSSWADQSKLNYAEQSFTESERQEALQDIQRLWKSVGEEGRSIFRQSQAVYSSTWNKRFTALRNELSRSTGLAVDSPQFKTAFGNTIDSALQKLKTGPYSPLQRYGDYLVTVRDAEGKIAWFSGHDTKAEADATASQLAASDFRTSDNYRVNTTVRTAHDWQIDGISASTVANLEKVAQDALPAEADAGLREEVRRALVEAYLQSLPQQSFLQHANKRKGVAGFTTDAFRAFNDYSIKAGRSIASLQYDGQISSKLNELQTFVADAAKQPGRTDVTKLQRVLNSVKMQHKASQNYERSPVADALSQAGFVFYMTSPSQLFINSMQTPMVTLPRLAGTYGNTAALKAVKNALGTFVKSGRDMLGEKSTLAPGSAEREVLNQLHERGVLDFTLAHDMTGLANGESSAMSGHWRRAMEVASAFMHRSEVFNRQVTALATTRLEMDKLGISQLSTDPAAREVQLKQLADAAEESVLTTQFDYSQSNKPKLMQGPWRKVIFQFQQYRVNMLAMMAKDIRDGFLSKDATKEEKATARRALAWMLGAQLAITGAAGTVLAPFAFAIADMFRDDDDLLDSRTEFTRAAPQWLAHGVLSGALDLQRLGSDSLIPILGDRAYAPKDGTAKDSFDYYVMRNIGPWAGLLGGASDGVAKAMNGDFTGATKGLLPAPIRDFYKSMYESQAGAKDARQVVYFEPGVWDTVTGAMGLRSGERREAEGLRGASYQAAQQANTIRQRYLGRLAIGHATGDQDMVNEAQTGIQEWNSAHPDMAIRGTDVKRAIINRIRAQQNATQYGVPTARPPSESLKEALAL